MGWSDEERTRFALDERAKKHPLGPLRRPVRGVAFGTTSGLLGYDGYEALVGSTNDFWSLLAGASVLFIVADLLTAADPHNPAVIKIAQFIGHAAWETIKEAIVGDNTAALIGLVVGGLAALFGIVYLVAVSLGTNNGGNLHQTAALRQHALSAALEQPRNCEQEPPVITIPSLDYLQSIPPSKARDALSATSGQFQYYRRFLDCLNEQIEFDKARFRNEAPNTLAATARSSRIHEWNNRYDRMYDRRGLYQQRFRSLIDAWCRIDVETVGCLQEFPT